MRHTFSQIRNRLFQLSGAIALLATLLPPSAHAAQAPDPVVAKRQAFALLLAPIPSSAPPTAPSAEAAPSSPIAPAPATKSRMLRWVYTVGAALPDSVRQHPDLVDVISPAWFHLDANGNIYGNDSPDVTRFAHQHGIKVMPIVANGEFDPDAAHDVFIDAHNQTRALDGLTWLVYNFGYDGINIDFENMYNADRGLFSGFMANVYSRIHRENGRIVTIALASKTQEVFDGFAAPFDYAGLAPNFDLAVVMTYDQHYAGGAAGPVASITWVEEVITYATKFIPPSKLLLGMPFYGYNWNVTYGGWAQAMSYREIVQTIFAHGPGIQMDPDSKTPVYTYSTGRNGMHQIWFENSTSLGYKLALAAKHGLAGWGAWRGGMEDQNFWSLDLSPNAA